MAPQGRLLSGVRDISDPVSYPYRGVLRAPVFSVYQTDVIYYGDNLLDYVAHEFKVPPPHPSDRQHIRFWSDLADGSEAADV